MLVQKTTETTKAILEGHHICCTFELPSYRKQSIREGRDAHLYLTWDAVQMEAVHELKPGHCL